MGRSDLLFLQQGRLCIAPGEQCCFYANYTGWSKDSLILEKDEEKGNKPNQLQSWFKPPLDWSPWITTLITGIVGLSYNSIDHAMCLLPAELHLLLHSKRIHTIKLLVLRLTMVPYRTRTSEGNDWMSN